MAQDMEEELSTELEAYAYNPDKAVEILKEDGWVYNADGSDYADGSGEIRYKKVPKEETEYMNGCVEVNGEWYMPLVLEYLGHAEGDGIETVLDELLTIYLCENDNTAKAGMKFNRTVMADSELLSYLNRRGANGEEKYTQPSYHVISLASGLGAAKFDKTYSWTFDENLIADVYKRQGQWRRNMNSAIPVFPWFLGKRRLYRRRRKRRAGNLLSFCIFCHTASFPGF